MFHMNQRKTTFPLNRYLSILLIALSGVPKNASASIGVYQFVDYLLWKPQENGLNYALAKRGDAVLEVQEPDFRNSSGVRIGLGFNGYKDWDVKSVWTHLRSCTSAEQVSDVSDGILATPLTMLNDPILHTSAGVASRFNLAFDTVDVDVGKLWHRCGEVVLNARLGAKWARINQTHNLLYTGLDASDAQAKVSRRNNFSGAGPCINVQAVWPVGCDLSLYAEASEAFLAGKVCTAVASGTNSNELLISPTLAHKASSVRFMSRLLVGLGWGRSVYNDCCDVYLRAGYEMQWWPKQWNACSSLAQAQTGLQQSGDLSLQGLVLTFGLYF
jgi:hypothetical protein